MLNKKIRGRVSRLGLSRMTVLTGLMIAVMAFATGCGNKAEVSDGASQQAVEEAAKSSESTIDEAHLPAFTDITFDTSEEEMLKKEGEPSESYPSLYGGTVYVFSDHEFNGVNGSVKYMTDESGNIACISWFYENDDTMDVQARFENIHRGLENKHGESGNKAEAQGNFGDAWNFDDVHIMLDAVITSDYKGMQLSYLKADYSRKDQVDQKRKELEDSKEE